MALSAVVAAAPEPIIKGPLDRRDYRFVLLPNRLRVLLVSDPSATTAAAAVDVASGSADDPDQRPGLAHLLEHMLFLGTDRYPAPDAFDAFLAANGGRSNAATGYAHSSYYFTVDAAQLAPALARFARLFAAPLLDATMIDRERRAVDAEYRAKYQEEHWRQLYALKQALNPSHPYARFAVGSLETLADSGSGRLRDQLATHFRRYFRADNMTLAVLGGASLDVLERHVRGTFGALETPPAAPIPVASPPPLFDPATLPARLDVQSLKRRRELALSFALPSSQTYFLHKPVRYLSYLIGHEGSGSLLDSLQRRGWAGAVSVHRERLGAQALLTIRLRLTETGLAAADDVAAQVFRYLDLIRRQGIDAGLFDEQRRLAELAFRFREDTPPDRYARFLAGNLHRYPVRYLLFGSYAMERFDAALIGRFLEQLRPRRALLTVAAPDPPRTDRREPWFETRYRLRHAGAASLWLHPQRAEPLPLSLPSGNDYLPDDLTLRTPSAPAARTALSRPVLSVSRGGLRLWHKQDDEFRVPRADIYLSLRSPYANDSAAQAVLTKLYVGMVAEQLKPHRYSAKLGGLTVRLYPHGRGLTLRLSGFTDKQPLLLTRVVDALRQPRLDASGFARVKDALSAGLGDSARLRPHRRALLELQQLLISGRWPPREELGALRRTTLEQLRAFVPALLGSVNVVGLAHGNVDADDVQRIAAIVERRLLARPRGAPAAVTSARPAVTALAAGTEPLRRLPIAHSDSVLVSYFQGPDKRPRTRALFDLLAELIAQPLYRELRTEQQIGYLVSAASMPLDDMPGLALVVQSPRLAPPAIAARVERFLGTLGERLRALDGDRFEAYKRHLLARLLTSHRSLSERSDAYWREIVSHALPFDDTAHYADALRALDLDSALNTLRVLQDQRRRRHLAVQLFGDSHHDALGGGGTLVRDWRELMALSAAR